MERPATLSELFDGSYQGSAELVRASAPGCPARPRFGVVEVGDAVLVFPYTPEMVFSAPVDRDGRVHASYGANYLDGRILGNELAFTIKTPLCETVYRMHFVWNHS